MSQFHDILDLYGFTQDQSQGLLEAVELADCNLELNESIVTEESLYYMHDRLKECFFRPIHLEREQFEDKFHNVELRAQLLPLLSPFIDPITRGNNISTKLLMGASEDATKERFNILIDLEKNGYHADTIYLLTGARDLWIDREEMTAQLVTTRLMEKHNISEMNAKIELEQSIVDFFPDKNNITIKRQSIVKYFTETREIIWPTEADLMQGLADIYAEYFIGTEFILVDAPMSINATMKRPNTRDTLIQMLESHQGAIEIQSLSYPDNKLPVAFVTTQPFGIYQEIQTISVFYNQPISIALVAKEYDSNIHISCIFDTFVRTLIYAGKDFVLEKIRARNTCST